MPTITVSKKGLLKQIGKHMSDEELKEKIIFLGISFEGLKEDEVTVEINPNRPDLLSEQGLGRALASFVGTKKGLRKYIVKNSGAKVVIDKSVEKIRPCTACAIVKNLKFDDEKIREIIQIQEKLHVSFGRNRKRVAIGIYPLEHIKLPIYYKALKPDEIKFQPLESTRVMSGGQIISQHPTGKEYGYLLEGFDKYPVFIDANNEILSMPPIINSHKTGKVSEKTTEVFIECSGFDLIIMEQCLNILVTTMADMGGKIYSMDLNYPDKKRITPNLEPAKMKVDLKYVNKILGIELNEANLKLCLEKMGFEYEAKTKKVMVPAYRTDILHMIDFAEDIGIAYGYDNIPEIIPRVATTGEEDELEVFSDRIREILIGHGFIEVKNYCLASKDDQSKHCNQNHELVEIKNSQAEERNVMRSWIIPTLLRTLSENKHREYPQNIFEIGAVFKNDRDTKTETGVKEEISLALVMSSEEIDFTRIKQVLDNLLKALNLNASVEETIHTSFIKGRVGKIITDKKEIAVIGEITPEVLSNFGLIMPVVAFEINMTQVFNLLKNKNEN
ncbi:phenylalanine--tRNA ligase subunit beta [Candidatus Woesearchaeota archaeon]|nr:phenylalanine--tRNA ligase subunit beta [Candidatus Woesearchaeota archaeon]